MSRKLKPLRVLHVLGSLNRGGVETWLMHVLRNIERERFHFDFLVHDPAPGEYDEQARSLGSRIILCPKPTRPWRYSRRLSQTLKEYGPYDVVHSHVAHYSGHILRIAYRSSVPVRVAHSHTNTSQKQNTANTIRKAYLRLMKFWIDRYANIGLATSERAALSLFGKNWRKKAKFRVLPYGFDFSPFNEPVSRAKLRSELNIPADAFVIGHVGRFVAPKNHDFLIDIAKAVIAQRDNTYFLLVGDGVLRSKIEQKVNELGISDSVIFTGVRADVPALMKGVIDIFLLPSKYEGLGIVLVEAQAAGLPCIISDVIPQEVDIVSPLVNRLSLKASPSKWADEILALRNCHECNGGWERKALTQVKNSVFGINRCVEELTNVYTA